LSARENILARVRSAIGRREGQPPAAIPEPRLRIQEATLDERIAQFTAALEKLAGKVHVAASTTDAADYVRSVVAGRLAIATNAEAVRECGIDYPPAGVSKAEVGITSADWGLADTGTLVVRAASEPRLFSLLPPVHVAVLRRERLLTGLDELLTKVPLPAHDTSSMVLITGPSRTADIEQILVRGVHGPGELHAVLL
jgi:L-lactate dehydrogenase complex protein LldG